MCSKIIIINYSSLKSSNLLWQIIIKWHKLFNSDLIESLPDTLGPQLFVEACVYPNIGCSHLLLRKLSDFLDSSWSTFLESNTMKTLVKVHCVFASHHLVDGTFSLLFRRLSHLLCLVLRNYINTEICTRWSEIYI